MKYIPIYTVVFLFIFGCNLDPSYEDIINKNLIPEASLDLWVHTDTGTVGPANKAYVLFEEESATGGFSGRSEYRLELKNLMPDGDFESGSLNGGWSTSPPPTVINVGGADTPIDNFSLYYDFTSGKYISFDLSNLNSGLLPSTKYRLNFDFNVETGFLFDYNDGTNSFLTDPNQSWNETYTSWDVREFPTANVNSTITSPSSGAAFFSIGTPDTSVSPSPSQNGYIDNFSIVKADGTYGISYQIEGAQNSEGIELIPGTYRFSVYIKQEDAADVTPNTQNRFRAEQVQVLISGPTSSLNTDENGALYSTSSEWSDWTKISVDSDSLRPAEGDFPITMTILPYKQSDRYSGSILISAPTLEYIP